MKFDIIGLSCNTDGPAEKWKANFEDLAVRYPQYGLLAAEYSYRKRELNDIVYNVPDRRGLGSFIWEPTRHHEAFFDRDGRNTGGGTLAPPRRSPAAATRKETGPPLRLIAPARVDFDTNGLIKHCPQMARDYGKESPAAHRYPPLAPHSVFACRCLPLFQPSGQFQEQVRVLHIEPGVTATVVAPPSRQFDAARPTLLVIYALPNGNTTAQTIGRAAAGLEWHFDIQHIGAQTRLLRQAFAERNIVVAYLENSLHSWPAWRQKHPKESLRAILAQVKESLPGKPSLCLTGHSGGGSFIFGCLNEMDAIPSDVERIAFLDSNYSFDDTHGTMLAAWLKGDPSRRLEVIAYDDRNITLNGKLILSPTGGTFRATNRMVESLRKGMTIEEGQQGAFIRFTAPQVEMLVHRNPQNKILHTALIGEMNGYLHALTTGTAWEHKLASLDGPRAYVAWIERDAQQVAAHALPNIPQRSATAIGGAAFIASLGDRDRAGRESAILRELRAGNIPSFLRQLVSVTVKAGWDGKEHTASYDVMPDYLAIGSDGDFVRMPMNPHTAQTFCDECGMALPTRKMSSDIWAQAAVRLIPQPLTKDRESPATFLQSQRLIEEQATGIRRGAIWAGIKKDIVVTNRLQERPHRLAIFGWHYPNGEPIQPLTTVHVDWYVDYSHGVRPVRRVVRVDGGEMDYEAVLRDPKLSALLSDEGPIARPRY